MSYSKTDYNEFTTSLIYNVNFQVHVVYVAFATIENIKLTFTIVEMHVYSIYLCIYTIFDNSSFIANPKFHPVCIILTPEIYKNQSHHIFLNAITSKCQSEESF